MAEEFDALAEKQLAFDEEALLLGREIPATEALLLAKIEHVDFGHVECGVTCSVGRPSYCCIVCCLPLETVESFAEYVVKTPAS